MEPALIEPIAQYGLAGLMGLFWMLERRHSAHRERELSEAHAALLRQQRELSELLAVIKENSTAMTALERSQARLGCVCEEILSFLRAGSNANRCPTPGDLL